MSEPAKLKLDGDTGSPDPKTGVAAADALLTPYREEDSTVWTTHHVDGAASDLAPLTYANDAPAMEARAVVLTSAMWRLVESHAAHMGLHPDAAVMHLLHLGFSGHMERKRRQGL